MGDERKKDKTPISPTWLFGGAWAFRLKQIKLGTFVKEAIHEVLYTQAVYPRNSLWNLTPNRQFPFSPRSMHWPCPPPFMGSTSSQANLPSLLLPPIEALRNAYTAHPQALCTAVGPPLLSRLLSSKPGSPPWPRHLPSPSEPFATGCT